VNGQLQASSTLFPGKKDPGIHWLGVWLGPTDVLDAVARRKNPCPCRPVRSLITVLTELPRFFNLITVLSELPRLLNLITVLTEIFVLFNLIIVLTELHRAFISIVLAKRGQGGPRVLKPVR
jgi:hypothetical protein